MKSLGTLLLGLWFSLSTHAANEFWIGPDGRYHLGPRPKPCEVFSSIDAPKVAPPARSAQGTKISKYQLGMKELTNLAYAEADRLFENNAPLRETVDELDALTLHHAEQLSIIYALDDWATASTEGLRAVDHAGAAQYYSEMRETLVDRSFGNSEKGTRDFFSILVPSPLNANNRVEVQVYNSEIKNPGGLGEYLGIKMSRLKESEKKLVSQEIKLRMEQSARAVENLKTKLRDSSSFQIRDRLIQAEKEKIYYSAMYRAITQSR